MSFAHTVQESAEIEWSLANGVSYQATVDRDSDTFSLVNANHAQQKVLPVYVYTLAAHDYLVRTPGNDIDARYSFSVACPTVGEGLEDHARCRKTEPEGRWRPCRRRFEDWHPDQQTVKTTRRSEPFAELQPLGTDKSASL